MWEWRLKKTDKNTGKRTQGYMLGSPTPWAMGLGK